jgi:hypothetical protein
LKQNPKSFPKTLAKQRLSTSQNSKL